MRSATWATGSPVSSTGAGLAGGVDRDRPRRLGQPADRVLDGVGDPEPDRERHLQPPLLAQAPQVGQELPGAAGAVGADQDRRAVPVAVGDLRQRVVDHRDVVGGVVRARVPRPQHPGQRLTGVVQPGQHRVIAPARLVGGGAALLLRVAGHQGGVDVDHQPRLDPTRAHHRRQRAAGLGAQQPGPFPRHRPRQLHLRQRRRVDTVQDPPAGRRRRHPPEQARLVPLPGEVGDRLPAVGEHHRHIDQHPTRRMRRPTHPATARGLVERRDQTRRLRDIGQQPSPDMRDDTPPVRRHHDPRERPGNVHL